MFVVLVGVCSLMLLGLPGCKSGGDEEKDKGKKGGPQEGPGARGTDERGPDGPGERGPGERGPGERGPGDGDPQADGPWPPPGVTDKDKATPPPDVTKLMELMVAAYNRKDATTAQKLFIPRKLFMDVSDCDPPDVVDRVIGGAQQAAERAGHVTGPVVFKGFRDGYLLDVKKGGKPAECTAKQPVKLYLTKFDWTIGAKKTPGEAHFLFTGGVWFFVKL